MRASCVDNCEKFFTKNIRGKKIVPCKNIFDALLRVPLRARDRTEVSDARSDAGIPLPCANCRARLVAEVSGRAGRYRIPHRDKRLLKTLHFLAPRSYRKVGGKDARRVRGRGIRRSRGAAQKRSFDLRDRIGARAK